MINEKTNKSILIRRWLTSLRWRSLASLALLFYLIEFFDEFNWSIEGAALPSLRHDLGLNYAQVGLLLGLPHILGSFIELIIMLLGDTPLRKMLIVGGGLSVVLSLALTAVAHSFPTLLLAMVIGFPASGAFVTLSQATLMDMNPRREPQMMARWTLSGSIGDLIGPLILAGGFAMAWGWRWAFFFLAGLALILTAIAWLSRIPPRPIAASAEPQTKIPEEEAEASAAPETVEGLRAMRREVLGNLKSALLNPALLRWIGLLLLSDLMLDVLTSYLPLYFNDVVKMTPAQTSLMMSAVMFAGLATDGIAIPMLERFRGRSVVRASAALVLVLYPAWLLAPWLWAKVILVLAVKLSTLGWYAVLQGEAFAAAPGRSGTVMAINSLASLFAGIIPWMMGFVANRAGLPTAMVLLLAGPVSLLLFVPKGKK